MKKKVNERFHQFAILVSEHGGSVWAFILALVVVIVWLATGPFFHFSDTWQLVINTGTTIVTFLMVFLIQNTQNRDAKAIHLKLDELLKSSKGARASMIDLEELSDDDLDKFQEEFRRLHAQEVARREKNSARKMKSKRE